MFGSNKQQSTIFNALNFQIIQYKQHILQLEKEICNLSKVNHELEIIRNLKTEYEDLFKKISSLSIRFNEIIFSNKIIQEENQKLEDTIFHLKIENENNSKILRYIQIENVFKKEISCKRSIISIVYIS